MTVFTLVCIPHRIDQKELGQDFFIHKQEGPVTALKTGVAASLASGGDGPTRTVESETSATSSMPSVGDWHRYNSIDHNSR